MGRRIALDVARGLHFLHSRKIVHFDLKSANILLARDNTAKIADVGLAKIMQQQFLSTLYCVGTFAWAAPEVNYPAGLQSAIMFALSMRSCLVANAKGPNTSACTSVQHVCHWWLVHCVAGMLSHTGGHALSALFAQRGQYMACAQCRQHVLMLHLVSFTACIMPSCDKLVFLVGVGAVGQDVLF